jgi:hypothetical protein
MAVYTPGELPSFFNPTRDTGYLELQDVCKSTEHELELIKWLHMFRERNPVLSFKITILEIQKW